jgi:low molecular weight protein-tyrosine phosphatase
MPEPKVRVCFVCLGNICRSPTAEGVLRKVLVRAGLEGVALVESAGTADYHTGELPDARSLAAAKARGVLLESRAQQFVQSSFARFDYVLAMDAQNLEHLKRLAPSAAARDKVRLLRSFDPASPPDAPVPDPYHGGADGFEEVLDLCEAACDGFLQHLRRAHSL